MNRPLSRQLLEIVWVPLIKITAYGATFLEIALGIFGLSVLPVYFIIFELRTFTISVLSQ